MRMSPAARYLGNNLSIDVSQLQGSGKGGMITKEDIIKFIHSGSSKSSSSSAGSTHTATKASQASPSHSQVSTEPVNDRYKDIPNNNMRKIIAKRLTESKSQVPHFYTSIECNVDSVMAMRKKLKKDYDLNVSVNDFVIKAAALALRDVPEANAKFDTKSNSISTSPAVDISVAVATPNGLITPILTQADKRSLVEINKMVKDLATRARDGKLKPEEFQGGSFSISNLGMYGVSVFSAVINPPQGCILAIGAGHARMVPSPSEPDQLKVVNTVTVQLSADRRVVDEAVASQFLQVDVIQ
jgi:pyruvate dehydrogenase E2 component (dihydrolipoamide acetyltransferase)